jgi:two-component system sensor histidine kinase/response regulator
MRKLIRKLALFLAGVRSIGSYPTMDEYELRKLYVFNQLNFVGALCGLFISIAGLFDEQDLPLTATLVALSPAVISSAVLLCNACRRYELGRMIYFFLYPLVTSLVYASGLDVGVELFFLLYGMLAVFYMKHLFNGLLAFGVSIACYLWVKVYGHSYSYELKTASFTFFVLIQVAALVLIFFALSWIKRENNGYQQSILQKNASLHQFNLEIEKQKEEIALKATRLAELDAVKNKLFSVISHDLKNPVYALRNLFRNVQQYDLPGDEIKVLVPDIVNDLDHTTALMENLLQWAKAQMQADELRAEPVDLCAVIEETMQVLRLQASHKRVYLQSKVDRPVYVYADKGVLNLVLRNLLSNAIKFTPEEGQVLVEAADLEEGVEICVADTGIGMAPDTLQRLAGNQFYTTHGTANEAGTGLGLMLCKDFLRRIGSRMFIESEPGKGSTFSFVLPRAGEDEEEGGEGETAQQLPDAQQPA